MKVRMMLRGSSGTILGPRASLVHLVSREQASNDEAEDARTTSHSCSSKPNLPSPQWLVVDPSSLGEVGRGLVMAIKCWPGWPTQWSGQLAVSPILTTLETLSVCSL